MSHFALTLAWRNTKRARRRTLITAIAVALGVWVATLFVGVRKSSYVRLIEAGASAGFGHIALAREGYFESKSPAASFSYTQPMQKVRASMPEVAVVPRLPVQAIVANSQTSTGALLLGIKVDDESLHHNIFLRTLSRGEIFAAADEQGCLVGSALAERLKLALDDKLVYTVTDGSGQLVSQLLRVRGVFRTGNLELDGHVVVTSLIGLNKSLGLPGDRAAYLALYAPDALHAEELLPPLVTISAPLHLKPQSWRTTLPDLATYISLDAALYRVLTIFVALIIASSVLNTMMHSVIERRRELGIMMALGTSPKAVLCMVGAEAFLISGLGLVLGALSLAPLAYYLIRYGLDLSALYGQKIDAGGVAIDLIIGLRLSPYDLLVMAMAIAVLTLAAALLPALRAVRGDPMAAISDL